MRDSLRTGNVKKPPMFAVCGSFLFLLSAGPLCAQPTPAPSPTPVRLPPTQTLGSDANVTPPPLATPETFLPGTPLPGGEPWPANVKRGDPGSPISTPAPTPAPAVRSGGAKFLGAMSCSSSLCHGGGSTGDRGAYTVWKAKDPHRQSFAVLAGTQAARIVQGLQLASAAASARCTECHAPLTTVAEERLTNGLDARTEGVSCENCHGPSANWIRSHTRPDFTHAQNVQTGVRDLRDLYARANACVACHQVIAPDVLAAGHPPLIFELDAQTVAEPRHWMDRGDFFGPQAWLTGQAAALRETSWSLGQQTDPRPEIREQWRALVWLLKKTTDAYGHGMPTFDAPDADTFSPGNVARAQSLADDLARAASRTEWTSASTRQMLITLAATDKDFVPAAGGEPAATLQNRAQRLALALSRLMAPFQAQDAAKWTGASKELDKLFTLADARMNFDGVAFADQLRRFRVALGSE